MTPDTPVSWTRYVPAALALVGAVCFGLAVQDDSPAVASGGSSNGAPAPSAGDADRTTDASARNNGSPGAFGESATGAATTPSNEPRAASGTAAGPVAGGSNAPAGVPNRPSGQPTAPGADFDCSRNENLAGPTCRPASTFTGDNGGATALNVDGDRVKLLYYAPKRNEQVAALMAAAGTASPAQFTDYLAAFEVYMNDVFETYGRHVELEFWEGPGAAADPAAVQADASTAAEEKRAFWIGTQGAIPAFHDELTRRGLPNFNVVNPFSASYYEAKAPLTYGFLPDFDYTTEHVAEYWCKRLEGRNAVHAGDPILAGSARSLGVIAIESEDDAHQRFVDRVTACGGSVGAVSVYAGDISTAETQATNAIVQMRQSGVTSITCLCDAVAPVFFTSAASEQGYFPEWIHTGLAATDHHKAGRLYDQAQWENSFGVSVLSPLLPPSDTPWGRAYFAGGGQDPDVPEAAGGSPFTFALLGFSAIEAAGPNLTPQTFTNAMLTLPPYGGGNQSVNSFGRNGPSPFTGVDDLTEIWWDPDRVGPDDKPGFAHYVDGGRRFVAGQWPNTDPNVFVDDGSPQQ